MLRDVALDLRDGETLAVLGPNGAGKTTLLRVLATLLRPTAGDVSVWAARCRGSPGELADGSVTWVMSRSSIGT